MKKVLSYRERLLELASIYNISEVRNYIKSKKTLTIPQLELILRKNKVPIPKNFNKSLLEIQSKKIYSIKNKTFNIFENFFKNIYRTFNYSLKKIADEYFNSEKLQQLLVFTSIAIVIIISIYIFFSFYIEIFLTLIFIILVLIYRKKK